jgi:iron complex outermembrane receptor protein
LTPRLDVSFQDDIFSSAVNTVTSAIESYYVANGRLTWRSEDLKWQASFEVTNLTDKYYYLTVFDALSRSGFVSGQPGRPREYAFTIKRTWYFD